MPRKPFIIKEKTEEEKMLEKSQNINFIDPFGYMNPNVIYPNTDPNVYPNDMNQNNLAGIVAQQPNFRNATVAEQAESAANNFFINYIIGKFLPFIFRWAQLVFFGVFSKGGFAGFMFTSIWFVLYWGVFVRCYEWLDWNTTQIALRVYVPYFIITCGLFLVFIWLHGPIKGKGIVIFMIIILGCEICYFTCFDQEECVFTEMGRLKYEEIAAKVDVNDIKSYIYHKMLKKFDEFMKKKK
jgi:hypothetical protein